MRLFLIMLLGQDIFKLLFNTVSEGILVVNENQEIVETNEAANKIFGYRKDQLRGQSINVLIPQNYHARHDVHFKNFLAERRHRRMGLGYDINGLRSNGKTFPLEASLNPFEIYGKKYFMVLIVDISLRKKQEKKISEINNELEKKVLRRTKELNNAIVELKEENKKRIKAENEAKESLKKEMELNDLKTKFLSMVSHEFKTPLSGILTSTILLGKYKLSEQQEKRDSHLKTITEKVHYLNGILNDFLSIEKLERGKMIYVPTAFKLSKIVDEVIYNANMELKEGQKIKYPDYIDSYSLYQDEKIMELILTNLVHNSIKYSPENTTIEITITQDKTMTAFTIKDQGIGIPENDQKNIFQRYFRAENVLLIQGTGIGLNIVKHHLENLGGHISFVSKENSGTEFTFSIPNTAL